MSTSSVIAHYKSSSVGVDMCVMSVSTQQKGQNKRASTRVRVEGAADQRRMGGQRHWTDNRPSLLI